MIPFLVRTYIYTSTEKRLEVYIEMLGLTWGRIWHFISSTFCSSKFSIMNTYQS